MFTGQSRNLNAEKVASSSMTTVVVKTIVSAWILYHIAGLLIAPASVPPSSPLIQNSWRGVGPYLEMVNMNQANHFFAPDPGASTILKFELEFADGTHRAGQIPDVSTSPRLLYHRHFMLTESLGASDRNDPRARHLLIRAFARELCHRHGAQAVTLTQSVHLLQTIDWAKAGYSPNVPELFEDEPLGRFELADFQQVEVRQ